MPKQYEAIRDKFVNKGMPLKEAKTHAAKIYNSTHHDNPVTGKQPKEMASGGPITAASIEAGGTPRQGGDGGLTGYSTGLSNPTPSSSPEIKPISTTDTLPGGGGPNMTGPTNPFATGSGLTPTKSGGWGGGGLTPSPGDPSPTEFQASGSTLGMYKDGGMVGPNTAGTSYSFPPPPGQRKQGPRNYGKKE